MSRPIHAGYDKLITITRESARDMAYIENNRPTEYDGGHKHTQMLEVKEIALNVS